MYTTTGTPPTLLCDIYKLSHKPQYPKGTSYIYSTWTPRASKFIPVHKVVNFGVQALVKKYLIKYFNENFFKRPKKEVIKEFERFMKYSMFVENPDSSHIEALHDLGYLPIVVRSLKEGTVVPIKTPMLTIENTHPEFFWLTNYLETIILNNIWQPMTSASIAFEFRKILEWFAEKTVGDSDHVPFQLHDFSMRGMGSTETTETSGAAHLLSFVGTDTVPAIYFHEAYYNANMENELIGTSIPATEHSVMSANSDANVRDEYPSFKRLITETYPNGFVSIVSDTYDFWKVIGDILPRLKDEIMARDGKVVIRPDSGDPATILCGIGQILEFEDADDAEDHFMDQCREEAGNECGDGCTGDEEYEYIYKVDDEYFKLTLEPFYNRHDKRYYYLDGWENVRHESYEPKLSDLGLIEVLGNIFGYTVNDLGYKVLDPHIGAIYGDSITLERAKDILQRLKDKGWASSNIVLGVGSYTYQYNTRDTFGFAMKATYMELDGKEKFLFKDPKTDDGTKRSQRGRVAVIEDTDGDFFYRDELNYQEWFELNEGDALEDVFLNGKLVRDESLSEIRERLVTYL